MLVSALALLAASKLGFAEITNPALLAKTGNGDAVAGKQKADSERCMECHGQDGNSDDVRIPSHAGQLAGYLVKQLEDFQSGARLHSTMTIMAADLTATDRADISSYFAVQPLRPSDGNGSNPRGKSLFSNGDTGRALPACASCHADNAKGKVADNAIYPSLAGQRKVYLRTQLVNWKLGERHNSPDGVMNNVAKQLTDDEIEALVDYLSAL